MNTTLIQNVEFDETATLAMGEAFDRACKSLHRFGTLITARELIAQRIIGAAKNGERDPARLHEQALVPFGIEDMSMLFISVGPKPPFQPTLRSRKRRDLREPGSPRAGLSIAQETKNRRLSHGIQDNRCGTFTYFERDDDLAGAKPTQAPTPPRPVIASANRRAA